MFRKVTQELLNELKEADDVTDYLEENNAEFCGSDLKHFLETLLNAKGLQKKTAISRSGLHEIYAYQIFSGKKAPSRDKVLALCLGMGLSLDEAQHVLNKAGAAALYPRSRRDSVVIFSLKKGMDARQCDELLYELGEATLQ